MNVSKVGSSANDGKAVFRKPHQAFEDNSMEFFEIHTADSTTTSSVQNANNYTDVQFYPTAGEVLSVELWHRVTAAAVVRPAPFHMWFNRLELFLDGGSVVTQTLYSKEIGRRLNLIPPDRTSLH